MIQNQSLLTSSSYVKIPKENYGLRFIQFIESRWIFDNVSVHVKETIFLRLFLKFYPIKLMTQTFQLELAEQNNKYIETYMKKIEDETWTVEWKGEAESKKFWAKVASFAVYILHLRFSARIFPAQIQNINVPYFIFRRYGIEKGNETKKLFFHPFYFMCFASCRIHPFYLLSFPFILFLRARVCRLVILCSTI